MAATRRSASGLRRMADPFVVAVPSGVSTRDRLHLTDAEAAALADIGEYLGGLYRADYRARALEGRLDAEGKAVSRRDRKRDLTAHTSSRWAGAITRKVEDQYHLGMRALVAERTMLRQATTTIGRRLAITPGDTLTPKRGKPVRGYRDKGEWFQKSRRHASLTHRLAVAETRIEAAYPRLVHGGSRLWHNRANLAAADMTEPEWRERWDASRWFLTADGETGKRCGNETIRVSTDGQVTIKVPAALVSKYGTHLRIERALNLATHRAEEWLARITDNRAVGYTITFDPEKGRWYLQAAWSYPKVDPPALTTVQQARTLAVDVNDEFLAAHVVDASGNPVGEPLTFTVAWNNLPASARDGHLRHTVTRLLHTAKRHGCASVTIENLNFADARATGRDTMGRGAKGKRFRRTVAGIPTAQFRQRLVAMAAEQGVFIVAVDPAYTSRWGAEHWQAPLNARKGYTKTSGPTTRHHAAAVVIGRRGHGLSARRTPVPAPPRRQRTTKSPARTRSGKHHTTGHGLTEIATPTPQGIKPDRANGARKRHSSPNTVRGHTAKKSRQGLFGTI